MAEETIRIMSDGLYNFFILHFSNIHDPCLHILNSLCPCLNLNPVFQIDCIRCDPVFNQQLVLFSFPIDIPSILLYSVPCPHTLLSQELPRSQNCHQSLLNMSYGSGSSPDLLLQQPLQVCVPALQYILSH